MDEGEKHLKPNFVGMFGGIIALVSVVLPWWTMTIGSSYFFSSETMSICPYRPPYWDTYQVTAIIPWVYNVTIWYVGYVALVLVLVGGAVGIVGSFVQRTRMILVIGGLLALLSVIIFAVGLQVELSRELAVSGGPTVSLFSSGIAFGSNYVTYLSLGFWLALVAGIMMLVASRTKLETGE